ncbi:venom serine carboxypeptidase-like isoform X2 [Amblyomma americanum]
MKALLLLLLFSKSFSSGICAESKSGNSGTSGNGDKNDAGNSTTSQADVGEPLFLTPLIEAGKYDEALEESRVGSLGDVPDVLGYSGFITVNEQLGSNLFFWFFPAMENPEGAPVMMWLQGGPGTSSLLGLFVEHGPYYVDENYAAQLREITWARNISVLYVDNPVGAGFSFTQSDDGYASNVSDVSKDMLEFLQQFFTLFDSYSSNDFYLAGESYAGKYIPAIGAALHDSRGKLRVPINLKGIAIGNGMIDPISLLRYGPYLYQIGLMDRQQATRMQEYCDQAAQMIRQDSYVEAILLMLEALYGTLMKKPTYFGNVTGYEYAYNYLLTKEPERQSLYETFVQIPAIRQAIHVGGAEFSNTRPAVGLHFANDIMKSVRDQFALLLDNYKALYYTGQLDIAFPYPMAEALMASLQWSGAQEFANATQRIWRSPDGDEVQGYTKHAKNFTMILARNGGHMLPLDQPEAAYEMITRFINDIPFVA